MEMIMSYNDSRKCLKDIGDSNPKLKEDCGAISNLIVLLNEELQKEKEGRKRGEKVAKMANEIIMLYESEIPFSIDVEIDKIKQKYSPFV